MSGIYSLPQDLHRPVSTAQAPRHRVFSTHSASISRGMADVWAQRQKAATHVPHAEPQGYSLNVREDLTAFKGPLREDGDDASASPQVSSREDLRQTQRAVRSRTHQHASTSGRQSAPAPARVSTRSQTPALRSTAGSTSAVKTAADGRQSASQTKRELFRRSAASSAMAPKRPEPQAEELDLNAELKSLLREMDDLDFTEEDEDLAYNDAVTLPQPKQLRREPAAVRQAAPATSSTQLPPPSAAPQQTASQVARPERIQLQAAQPRQQASISSTGPPDHEHPAAAALPVHMPSADAHQDAAHQLQAAETAEGGAAPVSDKWDAFWNDTEVSTPVRFSAQPVQPVPTSGAAAQLDTAAASSRGSAEQQQSPMFSPEELQEKPRKQPQPSAAKPRPGSEVPSFIVLSDAPPEAPSEVHPARGSAAVPRTSLLRSQGAPQPKPWHNSLLDQPYDQPAGRRPPQQAPEPLSKAAQQPPAPASGVQLDTTSSRPVSGPHGSEAAERAAHAPPAAEAGSQAPPPGVQQGMQAGTEAEVGLPAVRQLRPRSTVKAAARHQAEAPVGAGAPEDVLARFGLSSVPRETGVTLQDSAQEAYRQEEDDEEYFDEDLDDEAFWQDPGRGAKVAKRGPREVPAGSELDFFAASSFKGLGASEEMQAALQGLNIHTPSHVQAAAFKAMLFGSTSLLVADHAGSGKTLAYLAPLIQRLRQQEASDADFAPEVKDAPRALVLTPTAELCQQVLSVARGLARAAPVRSCAITGDRKWTPQKQALAGGVDMVVGTPGRVLSHVQAGTLNLQHCHTVVIDEVDVLLGDQHAFSAQTKALQQAVRPGTRFVMVTATLPEAVWLDMQAIFPDIRMAKGPRLHMRPPTLTERVVDCSGGDEISEESGFQRKAEQLLALLGQEQHPRTLIFCNKIPTCRKVENFLNRSPAAAGSQPLNVLPCHAAIEDSTRAGNLKAFLAPPDQAPMALVCTDRASRGLDSSCCSHVVLFDFPRDPSEYMRRAGRTARGASQGGLVSILVLGRQLKLARQIVRRNSRELPIHKLPTLPE